MFSKIFTIIHFLLLAAQFQPTIQAPSTASSLAHYPRRTIAGVSVVDTPIVRAAQELARQHSNDAVYKHVMRSWLFGTTIIAKNATLAKTVDAEVHAVATLLHDLGWDQDPNSTFVSSDRPFEVDGAIAARNFIQDYKKGKKWDTRRVQLVWDAIALHTQQKIYEHKEPEVRVTGRGILVEFSGPALGISKQDYDNINAEFPRDDFKSGVTGAFVWLCQTKPETTYGMLTTLNRYLSYPLLTKFRHIYTALRRRVGGKLQCSWP